MGKLVRIYTAQYCPFCVRAKDLFKKKNVSFQEIDVTNDSAVREKVQKETGWMTVPMIFIGDEFIGGFDDAQALEKSGQLDVKLK